MKIHSTGLVISIMGSVLIALSNLNPVTAGGDPWEPIDAQAIIDQCWKLSEKQRDSGVTARMRSGGIESAKCLRQQIVEHAATLFANTEYSEGEIDKHMELISEGAQTFYWNLYNEHKGCKGRCGTMYQLFHIGKIAHIYENILKDVISQRNEYKF